MGKYKTFNNRLCRQYVSNLVYGNFYGCICFLYNCRNRFYPHVYSRMVCMFFRVFPIYNEAHLRDCFSVHSVPHYIRHYVIKLYILWKGGVFK